MFPPGGELYYVRCLAFVLEERLLQEIRNARMMRTVDDCGANHYIAVQRF